MHPVVDALGGSQSLTRLFSSHNLLDVWVSVCVSSRLSAGEEDNAKCMRQMEN